MLLSDFDYTLPKELIANCPATPRDHSRLLVVHKSSGTLEHRKFFELPQILEPGDLLVTNNTRVIPARTFAKNIQGREFEILFLEPICDAPVRWNALSKPGKHLRARDRLFFEGGVTAEVFEKSRGSTVLQFENCNPERFFDWLFTVGTPPLPPYIERAPTLEDRENYQTVFASSPGAVAAPTAGLHFTPGLIESLNISGLAIEEITLHVGYGTFAPIHVENILEHKMHSERYEVSDRVIHQMGFTRRNRSRVIAVGTTTLRALESVPVAGQRGRTDLFISPGYRFLCADGLITNFHLPQSSLLILVSAFLGQALTRRVYAEAIKEKYRFFSYGDAVLILPT